MTCPPRKDRSFLSIPFVVAKMKIHFAFIISIGTIKVISAFLHNVARDHRPYGTLSRRFSVEGEKNSESTTLDVDELGLTPELRKITNAFESIGDDKLRYKQLLFMANQLKPMSPSSMIEENKVPGCLSTVYVDGKAIKEGDKTIIQFEGDSDGVLTKGLVALLVRGLSGNTAEDIQKVDPLFIQKAKINASLTPGRNNGFLNMLASMKKKALELSTSHAAENDSSVSSGETSDRPMYDAIITTLQQLKPVELKLVDNSYQHAGHAGAKGLDGSETHFDLYIVADAFDGLNLVKRHQLIYMLLGEVMPKIHALQIKAVTPTEVAK